jgi:hypothetical protein
MHVDYSGIGVILAKYSLCFVGIPQAVRLEAFTQSVKTDLLGMYCIFNKQIYAFNVCTNDDLLITRYSLA